MGLINVMSFLLIFFSSFLLGEQKICLNMIVKDEKPIIERCINSLKDVIDYWVIVDTGSTDGTQQAIRECLKGIPGQLYERPWVDFGYNRNEALQLARGKGDYILFIDADEVWKPLTLEIKPQHLTKDAYYIRLKREPESQRIFLIKDSPYWYWKGALHEQLLSTHKMEFETLDSFLILSDTFDGNRSKDPNKWLKDAQMLEKALLEDPDNLDYLFYLGQSYANAKEYKQALAYYLKRAERGGGGEYVFWSLYVAAKIQDFLQYSEEDIFKAYHKAYECRPTRSEPLYQLARKAFAKGNYFSGYVLAKHGLTLPLPKDFGYVEKWIYEYGILVELANCAFKLGKKEEALATWQKLLTVPSLPTELQEEVKKLIETHSKG